MSTHVDDDDPQAERLAAILGRFDEALAGDLTPPSLADAVSDLELLRRAHEGRQCLEAIERAWPRPGLEPTLADPQLIQESAAEGSGTPGRLGRFEILGELGRGGFGIVFLAHDPTLGRKLALKVPRPEVLAVPELRRRFLREARAAAGLDHPNLVPVFEVGRIGPVDYIASAYCEGPTLAAWLRQETEPIPSRLAARLVLALAGAIRHAHERGVLHRDLKPNNILLQPVAAGSLAVDGLEFVPRVADFGLARMHEPDVEATQSGVPIGSPPYMAPEQAEGRVLEIGPATDIYALGAILYELLAGRPPFQGATPLEIIDQVRHREPEPLERLRPRRPRDLATICRTCLRKEPADRYANAAALADDLGRFLDGLPIRARRVGHAARLGHWCTRPERIRDAGLLTVVLGLTFAAICIIGLGALAVGILQVDRPGVLAVYLAGIIVVVYLPMAGIGALMLARKPIAFWAGLVLALACLAGLIADFAGTVNADRLLGDRTLADPKVRFTFEALYAGLFGLEILVNAIALVAYHANRGPARRSRSTIA